MSVVRIISIFCDADADGEGCPMWVAQTEDVASARRIAKRAGWKRVDGRDLCPKHAG